MKANRGEIWRVEFDPSTGQEIGKIIPAVIVSENSIGYSSIQGSYWARGNDTKGFIALYDVNTGVELEHMHHQEWMSSLDRKALLKHGNYDSFFAKGGADLRNNEYIVYEPAQCTVRYLIEMG